MLSLLPFSTAVAGADSPDGSSPPLQAVSVAGLQLCNTHALEVRRKLALVLPIAAEIATTRPSCRALFERLGTTPESIFGRVLYYPPGGPGAARCSSKVAAFTWGGSPATMVCPSFGRLEARLAVMILIHEALHFAGLEESPTPGALTPGEINQLVLEACL